MAVAMIACKCRDDLRKPPSFKQTLCAGVSDEFENYSFANRTVSSGKKVKLHPSLTAISATIFQR